MDLHCIHCSERVDRTMSICRACGGDPWVKAVADVVDLTEPDPERDALELLSSLLAGYKDEPATKRMRFGEDLPTEIEIDLAPIRVGSRGAADVLPEPPKTRRSWRR